MKPINKLRIAVIGVGAMGKHHMKDIESIKNIDMVAICDTDREKVDGFTREYNVPGFHDYNTLLAEVSPDAILISTPHYDHPSIAIDAFDRGIHVLTEKPIAVHVQAGVEMIGAYKKALEKNPDLVFAVMFQQRTYGYWKKIKSLIDEGDLGKLMRATWIITDWFRTQSYYNNGGWRATWKGEGGGVLLNQCMHNIDLFQWFLGMPKRVTGHAFIGKYHNIEVEDEVTAFLEYGDGMVGHIITSTAESPGTNRLEIVGGKGKLIFEDNGLTFFQNRTSMLEHIKNSPSGHKKVESWKIKIPFEHHGLPGHRFIIENFANAILDGEGLIAPAVEGINSLMLVNSIMQSSFLGTPVDLPIDATAYAEKITELAENSHFEKVNKEREVKEMEE